MQQAVEADSYYALAYSALAEAWMTLGYDAKAEDVAKTAFRLSGKLGLEQKLLIEGRYHEAAHHWQEAVSAYRTLFHAYPDNVEYGLRLARAQRLAAQYPDAQATLQSLQKLPAPFSSDPRIDLEESMIGEASGDVSAAKRAAESAEQKGRERGSALLVARAKLVLPVSTLPAFVAEQEEARQTCERLGDRDCVGQAWLRIGRSQIINLSARTALERALAIFEQVGDQRSVGETQSVLSNFFLDRREYAEARRLNAAARVTCDTIGDRSCITSQILNDGNIDSATGDATSAEAKYRQALSLARQTGEDQLIWGSLNNLASLLSDNKGDLPQAEAAYRQLVELDRKSGKKWRMDFTLSNLGAVLTEEGHLAEARRVLNEVQDHPLSVREFATSAAAPSAWPTLISPKLAPRMRKPDCFPWPEFWNKISTDSPSITMTKLPPRSLRRTSRLKRSAPQFMRASCWAARRQATTAITWPSRKRKSPPPCDRKIPRPGAFCPSLA